MNVLGVDIPLNELKVAAEYAWVATAIVVVAVVHLGPLGFLLWAST